MKKLLTIALLLISANSFAQDSATVIKNYTSKGQIYYEKGYYAAAAEAYKVAYEYGDKKNGMVGYAYERAKDYPNAIKYYKMLIDNGNMNAALNLATIYLYGSGGTPKRVSTAMNILNDLADKGDRTALATLGDIYRDGTGVPKNYKTAMVWYMRAVSPDNVSGEPNDAPCVSAMIDIGKLYEFGNGVGKDINKAIEWYKKAQAETQRQEGYTGTDGKMYFISGNINPPIEEHIKRAQAKL